MPMTKANRIVVRTGTADEFFARARTAARRADQGKPFEHTLTLSFEDPGRMFAVMSPSRRELVQVVMRKPMTLAELTRTLRRERAAVAKDVKLLESAGLLESARTPNPGHGVNTWVRATARRIDLLATLAA